MIHVDREVLGNPDADGKCELADGPTVPAETARRLACDGSVCEVMHGPDGEVAAGFRYFWPNGTEAVAAPPRPELAVTGAWRMAMQFVPRGVVIGPETGRPTWMGEKADYDFMGDVLRGP
jgi:hypothetical protein